MSRYAKAKEEKEGGVKRMKSIVNAQASQLHASLH